MQRLCLVSLVLLASACASKQPAHGPSGSTASRPTPHQVLRTAPQGGRADSCPYTPCGGSVQGSWTFSESCSAPISMPDPGCPSSTGSVTPSYNGSVSFNSDGTYSRSLGVTGPLTLHLPAACASDGCAAVANYLNSVGYYTGVSCSSDGSGGCNCTGQMAGAPQTDTGTYSVNGNNITTTPYPQYGLPAETDAFCVNGNTFSIEINSTGSVLTATKQ